MAETSDLVKEEFTQNYLQYRWFDDTRGKLIDRFFILTAAVFVARLQFTEFLSEKWWWLLILYLFYVVVSTSFAYTIISFRRQQRGHNQYIKCLRGAIFEKITMNPPEFKGIISDFADGYKSYLSGRKVFLTKYLEFSIAIIASFSPFLFAEISNAVCPSSKYFLYPILIMTTVVLLYKLLVPWYHYNSSDQIQWNKD